jgi:taurine--2-oxoglutarate transaminase
MTLTGDPRRWANEPAMSGVVHVLDPYHGPDRPADDTATALARLEETIQLEGPDTIAAFFLETVTGTNGILIPPDGYMQGVRELCTRYGILMVSDEIMCGFGRTGEWFAVNHWNVVPDIISCAKGLTSSYAPLGALGLAPHVADHFQDKVFWGGLTYNTHPVSVAAALATIAVYEEDGLLEHTRKMGDVMARHHQELKDKHPSVGAVRNIGLFGCLDLVKNRETMEPISAFNTTSETMAKVNRFLLDNGLYTMVHWWTLMTNPPLPITEEQLGEGFEIIDRALQIADAALEG